MQVLIANLDENGTCVGEQIPRHGEPVAKVREVRVDTVAPGVAKGFDLFGFASDVVRFAIGDFVARGAPLEVRVKRDAVRRVDVNTLDFAAQPLALGQRGP